MIQIQNIGSVMSPFTMMERRHMNISMRNVNHHWIYHSMMNVPEDLNYLNCNHQKYKRYQWMNLQNSVSLLTINSHCSQYGMMDLKCTLLWTIDKSNMICLLTLHSDGIIDITTKDGRDFRLLQHSAKAASVMDTTIVSSPSTRTSMSISHVNASRQCIWCDNFGHYYSECQEFHEAIRRSHIYLNKYNRIINARSGKQLPLAIGRGGMKACL